MSPSDTPPEPRGLARSLGRKAADNLLADLDECGRMPIGDLPVEVPRSNGRYKVTVRIEADRDAPLFTPPLATKDRASASAGVAPPPAPARERGRKSPEDVKLTAKHYKVAAQATPEPKTGVRLFRDAQLPVTEGKLHSGQRQILADLVQVGLLNRAKKNAYVLPPAKPQAS